MPSAGPAVAIWRPTPPAPSTRSSVIAVCVVTAASDSSRCARGRARRPGPLTLGRAQIARGREALDRAFALQGWGRVRDPGCDRGTAFDEATGRRSRRSTASSSGRQPPRSWRIALGIGFFAGLGPYHAIDVKPTTERLTLLPLELVPTVAVPVAITLHTISLSRLRTDRTQAPR
jgi:hypothetical protein